MKVHYIGFLIAFILYFTANLNAVVYDVFSDTNNIYYSTLNNFTNSYILYDSDSALNYLTGDTALDSSILQGLIYSKDIKSIEGANGGDAVFFHNIKSYIKLDYYTGDGTHNFEDTMTSFTLEFYLNPYRIRMNSQVLSKTAIYNENGVTKSSGIKANIVNGRLVWQFNNLFSYNGVYTNVMLTQGEYLKENEWRHHSVSFNAATGKLVKYIDGLEEQVIYLTSTGDETGSPYTIEFDNIKLDPLYLGNGFIGGLDAFYFTPRYKQTFNLYPYTADGEIISKVIDFENKNTFIDSIDYVGNGTNGSYIDLYYRTSDYYFAPGDVNIAWEPLKNHTNMMTNTMTRYVQVRAVLKSNVDRNVTPVLNNVSINYHNPEKPLVPSNLTATAINGTSVMLKWNGSHENISGYKIYYGTKSGVYNEAQYTPIVIENVQEYTVEGLEEGRVYYFTVTAIGGEGGNIESGFSEEVYVRPIQ
ncbi:fibronectin type III domain-containing protein [Brachyspira intermedia]|uniref:fibronectin type III domain-containing protein n=1 Tax=Brachyspira intermedia TaxID=84377 RepID=UPI0030066698